MFIHQTSYFLFLFFIVVSTTKATTINSENDSNDDIELTSDMWVS